MCFQQRGLNGKEVKKVEFGAKINKLQIDDINFIQYISFDPFNESTQFKDSIYQAQKLTKVKVRQVGADAIYATNAKEDSLLLKKRTFKRLRRQFWQ